MIIFPIDRSQSKRDLPANGMIYPTADEAYNAVMTTEQPGAYVAEELDPTLPNGGQITVGDGVPETDVPLRTGFNFEFFMRTYPQDVSACVIA